MIHRLKIEDRWLERIADGQKTHEVRYNDRDYQVGDDVLLVGSVSPGLRRRITHVLRLSDVPGLGASSDWVVLSLCRD